MMAGIIDYAWYIPKLRIKRGEYIQVWGAGPAGVLEKSIADFDEDTVTMAVESAKMVLKGHDPASVDLLCVASTSFPYAYRMIASTLVDALGLRGSVFCTEHSQSTRSGTEAFLTALTMLESPGYDKALMVATDAPRARLQDRVEQAFGAASVAFVLGTGEVIAEIEGQSSFVHEYLGERFRLTGSVNVEDLGMRRRCRDAMRYGIGASVEAVLARVQREPSDYRYCAIQQTEDVRRVASSLSFTSDQIDPVLTMQRVGDTGASSPLLALACALSIARPKERILLASYAPGAGSDAISIVTTEAIDSKLRKVPIAGSEEDKEYVDYITYLKVRGVLE
jgi:hydroxymethylglutaryl-CoA synthase